VAAVAVSRSAFCFVTSRFSQSSTSHSGRLAAMDWKLVSQLGFEDRGGRSRADAATRTCHAPWPACGGRFAQLPGQGALPHTSEQRLESRKFPGTQLRDPFALDVAKYVGDFGVRGASPLGKADHARPPVFPWD
jgi:hypothetical protein